MALLDDLILRVQPQAGDTVVKNLIDDSDAAPNGAGTLTLVDVGSGKGWKVTSGTRTGTFSGGAAVEGSAVFTAAIRVVVNSRGSDFNDYIDIATSESSSPWYGVKLGNAGSSAGALRFRMNSSNLITQAMNSYTTGNAKTFVIRWADNHNGSGHPGMDIWEQTTGRSINDPDFVSEYGAGQTQSGNIGAIRLCPTTSDVTFTHIMVWNAGKTDAECAAVADDIEGQMPLDTGVTVDASITVPEFTLSAAATSQIAAAASIATDAPNLAADSAVATGATADLVMDAFQLATDITTNGGRTVDCAVTFGPFVVSASGAVSTGVQLDQPIPDPVLDASVGITIIADASLQIGEFTLSADATTVSMLVTDIMVNNTGTPQTSLSVSWTWFPAGRVGSMEGVTQVDGTGTTDGAGRLTISGLSGPGVLMVAVLGADATNDAVYYEAFG